MSRGSLSLVHRDVSPQNILVGADGAPRVADFGVAKAAGRATSTRDGRVKGKAGYMAPEQLRGGTIDRRVDVYASAVVLWELLVGRRLFVGESPAQTMLMALEQPVDPPGKLVADVPGALDALVMRGLSRAPDGRFATALDMAAALEHAVRPATAREVATWLGAFAGEVLRKRAERVAEFESSPSKTPRDATAHPDGGSGPRVQEAASQVSSISVATPQASRPLGRPLWVWGALAGVVTLASAGAISLRREPPPHPNGPSPETPIVATSTASEALPQVSPPATPTPTSASTYTTATTAVITNAVDAGITRPRVVSPPDPRARPGKTGAHCNPPYTLDPSGIHIAKPECL
jgi:eukaryotic-like serine/threonine-protein kinase